MKHALIVGGTNGIGLAVALKLAQECDKVTIVGRKLHFEDLPENVLFIPADLSNSDLNWTNKVMDADFLLYSTGIGRVIQFKELTISEIEHNFRLNAEVFYKLLNIFKYKLFSDNNFYCGVISSIASRIASPLLSVYSATKASIFRGVEAINSELAAEGYRNRICEIAPGNIKGTSFTGRPTELSTLEKISVQFIEAIKRREPYIIPDYENVYKNVINRYTENPSKFALESLRYKLDNNRLQPQSNLKIGYLSGSFDLFHIGHLNLLRNARSCCDYLVVGVHKDGSHKGKELYIPFEERMEIVKNIKYVDQVIESEKEDCDVWIKGKIKYDRLFVGSDYKGTERFNRYEEFFKDKNVEIIYFPYTQGTSSTQLRSRLEDNK